MDSHMIDVFVRAGLTDPVTGYLDPGLGGMIVSAVVGILATISLACKGFWYKLIGLFRKKAKTSSDEK